MIALESNSLETLSLELENKTTKELKEICKELELKAYSRKKKDEIIKLILKNSHLIFEEDEEDPYENSEEMKRNFANKYFEGKFNNLNLTWEFKGLKEISISGLNDVDKAYEIATLAIKFSEEIKQYCTNISNNGQLKPNTLLNYKCEILGKIEKKVKVYKNQETMKDYARFKELIDKGLKNYRSIKPKKNAENINLRQSNVLQIKCYEVIKWSIYIVKNLPNEKSKWREVSIALGTLTGRRLSSEILATAKFSESNRGEKWLHFVGQCKSHNSFNDHEGFDIPLIGINSNDAIEALAWLEMNGKRCLPKSYSFDDKKDAAKKSHNRYSRYLSEKTKDICNQLIKIEGNESWTLDNTDRRKTHLFRQIYAQIACELFFDKTEKKPQILTKILGHSDSKTSTKYASQAYDADVNIIDLEEIRELK